MASGKKFRTLNLMDGYTGEALWMEVDTSLPGLRVVQVLEMVAPERGFPEVIQVDKGPEFISRVMDQWASANGVALHFIDPGKPVQNAFIESFNGKFRDECLSQSWYTSLEDARQIIEPWRMDYNTVRPHRSLGYRTPAEYAVAVAARPAPPPRRSSPPHRCWSKPMYDNPEVLTYDWIKTGGRSGEFLDANGATHDFSRSPSGTFVNFDALHAGKGPGQGTRPSTNNQLGALAGWYVDGNNLNHGVVWCPCDQQSDE